MKLHLPAYNFLHLFPLNFQHVSCSILRVFTLPWFPSHKLNHSLASIVDGFHRCLMLVNIRTCMLHIPLCIHLQQALAHVPSSRWFRHAYYCLSLAYTLKRTVEKNVYNCCRPANRNSTVALKLKFFPVKLFPVSLFHCADVLSL